MYLVQRITFSTMELHLEEGVEVPKGGTVVWGSPSVGNVGQLCVDVLLATLAAGKALKRVGTIETSILFPVSGYEDLGDSEGPFLCSPLELYLHRDSKVLILQQRSSMLSDSVDAFAQALLTLLQEQLGCARLVVTCGAGLNNVAGLDIVNKPLFFVKHGDEMEEQADGAKAHGDPWRRISAVCFSKAQAVDNAVGDGAADVPLGVPVVRAIMQQAPLMTSSSTLHKALEVEVAGMFCREGNNAPHGFLLAGALATKMQLWHATPVPSGALTAPKSWAAMFTPGGVSVGVPGMAPLTTTPDMFL